MNYKNLKSKLIGTSLVFASVAFLGAQEDRSTMSDLGDYRIDRSIRDEAFDLAKEGDSEAAIERLRDAVTDDDDSIAWHYRHASVLLTLAILQNQVYAKYTDGEETALVALEEYQSVLKRLGDDGDTFLRSACHKKIALIYDRFVGNRSLAIDSYKNALAVSPEDKHVTRHLRRLHADASEILEPTR